MTINLNSYVEGKVFELLGRKIEIRFYIPTLEIDLSDNTGELLGSVVDIEPSESGYNIIKEFIYVDLQKLLDVFYSGKLDIPVKYYKKYLETGELIKLEQTDEELFLDILDTYLKHEVGHIISINQFLEKDPATACSRYEKLMNDTYEEYAKVPEATDIPSLIEMKQIYYSIELERMANAIFGLSYLDL